MQFFFSDFIINALTFDIQNNKVINKRNKSFRKCLNMLLSHANSVYFSDLSNQLYKFTKLL